MPISPRVANDAVSQGFLRRWLGPAVLAAAMSTAGGAHADDGILTWIVKSISSDEDGDVIQASAMRVPQVGTALATGQLISTSAGQYMVLVNGRDLVEVRPNSTVTIGDSDPTTADANVDLVNGTIHVEVGKRTPGQTFSIGAPYLVAAVKGTKFDVSSSSVASIVSVTEGTVAVSAAASGQSVDVTRGKTAIVGNRNPDKPTLGPTAAGGTPGTIDAEDDVEDERTESADSSGGSNSGGSNSGGSDSSGSSSDGSGSGGSGSGGSGGSDSGGSDSGGSDSGGSGSGGSDSGGSDSGGSGSGGSDSSGSDSAGSGGSDSGGTSVGDAVGDATGALGDAVGDTTGALGDALGGDVGDAVTGIGDKVGDAVGGLGGAVGGLLGGGR
jgi:FecR protein